jgi:superfamily II DNA/RNA helicase
LSFEQFGFPRQVEKGIEDLGYKEPTPIQSEAIPHVRDGRDVIGLAQTGTGKTAAFMLPILTRLMEGPRRRIRALVISPTRELAEQTHEAATKLGRHTGLKSMVIYGGVSYGQQQKVLGTTKGEVVVACPGRLLDHLGQRTINLSQVEVVVLDEADRLLDMGFLPDIRRILRAVPRRRQTLMFSATMPDDIRRLADEVLKNPVNLQVGSEAPAQNITHQLFPVDKHLKTALLKALLTKAGGGPILVFTKTRDRAHRLGLQLKRDGFHAASIQGSMTQAKRQAAMDGFRSGKHQVLVATDVAARGIDVEDISHVINYDMPENVEDYIHRVGRTGRVDKKGEAYSIISPQDAQFVIAFERVLDVELIEKELEDFDYNAAPPPMRRHVKSQRSHQSRGQRKSTPKGRRGRGKGERSTRSS